MSFKIDELEHFTELQQGKKAAIEIDESDLDDRNWKHCLIGHFLDGPMPFPLLKATARVGSCFFFEFQDEATKLRVLEGGPYFFSCRYLVLKDWNRMMIPSIDHPSSIPAWIKIHKLPFEFWTAESFSKIASTIGKPLHVDKATEKRQRLDFARVCGD